MLLLAAAPAGAASQTFTAATSTFTVPAGIGDNTIHIVATGGAGAGTSGTAGRNGALVSGDLTVAAGQQLQINVGYGGGAGGPGATPSSPAAPVAGHRTSAPGPSA